MRLLLFLLATCVGIGIGTHAEAQNYPWCAAYSGGDTGGGGTNCGFTTFQQCLETSCWIDAGPVGAGIAYSARTQRRYPH